MSATSDRSPFPLERISTQVLDHMPYELLFLDEQGGLVYGNHRFLEKLGYSPSQLTKLTIFDINTTSTARSWKLHWETIHLKGRLSFEEIHKDRKGNFYPVWVEAMAFELDGIPYIGAIVADISHATFDRNMLDTIEDIAQVGGWELRLNDSSLVVSQQCMRIFGLEDTEDLLPGRVIRQFLHGDVLKERLSALLREGIPYDETLELAHRSGCFVRCMARPIRKGERIVKVVGTYQDVSASIRKEQHLASFEHVIQNARDIIYFVDADYRVKYANQSTLAFVRRNKEDLIGQKTHEILQGLNREKGLSIWDQVRRNQVVESQAEVDFEGRKRHFVSNFLSVEYQGEQLMCVISRDITDLKHSEQRLRKALMEVSEMKDELEYENQYLKEEVRAGLNFEHIVCQSESYARILQQVEQVAPTDSTVLLTGESGTGKELLARALHEHSLRKDRALIKVNCATLPKDLIESELFGHRKGAFTGATEHKVGKFTLADQGTLFLDEIGELPLELQPKLLRVLQDGEFDEVGGTKTLQVDVRIIAATNRDLERMVREGTFREDLYYRLNVFPIHNIPLRERREDIPLLAEFFLQKYGKKIGKSFHSIHPKTLSQLSGYAFPGNIRELENLIERAVIVSQPPVLKPGPWIPKQIAKDRSGQGFVSFEEAQRDYIVKVLAHTDGKVSGPGGAAEILHMNDKTLFAKMKRLGIARTIQVSRPD